MRMFTVVLRRLVAAAGFSVLLAGIPLTLVRLFGVPDVDDVRVLADGPALLAALTSPLSDSAITAVLVGALWLIWARFVVAVLANVPAALSGAHVPRIRLLGPEQAIAAFLFTAVGVAPAAAATAAPAAAALPVAAAPATAESLTAAGAPVAGQAASQARPAGSLTAGITATPVAQAPAPRYAAAGYDGPLTVKVGDRQDTVTVARDDTLWDIAERHLHDPYRWPEIYQLNRDRYDDNGHMRGGQHIEAGWHLRLPADASTRPDNAPIARPSDAAREAPTREPARPAPTRGAATSPAPIPSASVPLRPAPSAQPPSASTPAPDTAADNGDDGVVEPPTAAPPDTSASTPAAPSSARSAAPPQQPRTPAAPSTDAPTRSTEPPQEPRSPASPALPGVALPGGGWIDLGLAAAIIAAVTAVWGHRRRRYARQPASPRLRLAEPESAAMPAIVNRIRRGLRMRSATPASTAPPPADIAPAEEHDDVSASPDAPTVADEEPHVADDDTDDDPYGPATTAPPTPWADETDPPELPGAVAEPVPVSPALTHPVVHAWPPAGLGLVGDGAHAAARGFLAATLASGVDDPHTRGCVVMPSSTCATLFGADTVDLARSPRLIITAGLPEALSLLENHTLHRTRLVYDGEADTIAALRDSDPFAEPLVPLVLLADTAGNHERTRVAALLTQGQRLDIHGILLGAWPDGDTVTIAADGTTSPAAAAPSRHGVHAADIGRLSVLTPQQTIDVVRVLAEAHTGERQPATVLEAPHPAAPAPETTGPDDLSKPVGAPPHTGTTAPEADDGMASEQPAAAPAPAPVDEDEDVPTAAAGRVTVRLLGPPVLLDRPTKPVFRLKAAELLAYLSMHNRPVHRDTVMEDVLGDVPLGRAGKQLNTFVSNLRQICKVTGGSGTYVRRDNDRYALHADAFDIDVWRMRDALTAARTADSTTDRISALRAAVDTYTGEFAEGCQYDWAEPYRQALRTQALDAAGDLADALTEAGQLHQAAEVLQHACTVHPHAEQLYQQAMRVHAACGDPEAIRRVRRTLTRHLADLDTTPSDETIALADELLTGLKGRPRRNARPRPPEST